MSENTYTPLDEITQIHASLNKSFRAGKMQNVAYRKRQIARVAFMIHDNLEAIHAALAKDLGRTKTDTALGEVTTVYHEAAYSYNHVDEWVKDIKPETTVAFRMMNPRVKPSPKGVVLIIGAFNYPINLTFTPLVSALAAGCCAVLKLPESLATTTPLLAALVEKYLDPGVVRVVLGAVDEMTALLRLEWNHIFFTGSPRVGRIVASAAAKHVTPVTLELGGKCPVIVDPRKADYTLIARRILSGRTTNGGQHKLATALAAIYKQFFPEGAAKSDSYGRLVNMGSAKRVSAQLDRSQGKTFLGGQSNGVFMEPTVLTDVKGDDAIMQDELFAPILSIVPVETFDEAIDFINDRPQPLALYVFTKDSKLKEKIARNTRSGSIVYNDTVIQAVAPGLSFGGSGNSGYGGYHGKYGFDTFTHYRSSTDTPNWLEAAVSFRYPPFSNFKYNLAMGSMGPLVFPFDKDGNRTRLNRLTRWAPYLIIAAIVAFNRKNIQKKAMTMLK